MKKLILVAAAVLFMCSPLQVFASEESSGLNTVSDAELNNEEGFSSWEIVGTDLSERYNVLREQLSEKGFGEEFKLQLQDTKGYSMNAIEVFEDTYGELWNSIQLESPELPKNFSASDFIKQGLEMRDSIYGEVKQSDIYQSVMTQMDVNSIWDKASSGLPSASSLLTNSFRQDFSTNTKGEREENQDYLAEIQEGALDLFTESGSLLSESNKSSFWAAVEDMRDILSENGSMEDIFDKME